MRGPPLVDLDTRASASPFSAGRQTCWFGISLKPELVFIEMSMATQLRPLGQSPLQNLVHTDLPLRLRHESAGALHSSRWPHSPPNSTLFILSTPLPIMNKPNGTMSAPTIHSWGLNGFFCEVEGSTTV